MKLESFLSTPFDSGAFEDFIFERFSGFEANERRYDSEDLNESEQKHIDSYRYLGQVELDDGKEIGFFEFRSKSDNIENRRVGYNAIAKKLAAHYFLDGAIASFYYPANPDVWRLSLVGFEYNEGKTDVTNLKRYTYVLGKDIPIKTPSEQFKSLQYPTYNELLDAFSVEKVSKEFFDEYKGLYQKIKSQLEPQIELFDGDSKNIDLFVKKLLGRIVFIYFLAKKGWLNSDRAWQNGDKRFLSNCFAKQYGEYDNFYSQMLQPIFFEALNQDRRKTNDIFPQLNIQMPFLNGGLFNQDRFDKLDIIIEDDEFKNIFETFDRFNFTIIEDNPNESEVAIDPEMLGRVFESLLEDRKEKGAFYTPREIVHYMSRKSIESYLQTQLNEHKYDFTVEEFLDKTKLDDDAILEYFNAHPMKFIKIDNYFEHLHPYKNLVIDFFVVAKLRGMWIDNTGTRIKNKSKSHSEVNSDIWETILTKEYRVVGVNFGSNKKIKSSGKQYKYPTLLKYIQIQEKYFTMAFLPNILGDLELTTIFPIRYKEIKRKLKKIGKNLEEISESNFAFNQEVFDKLKELQEDCRPLHTEPLTLFQVEELPRQAVVQKGLSTFYNSFNASSLTHNSLKNLLGSYTYYDRFINALLSNSNTPQDHLKKLMIIVLKKIKVLDPAIGSGAFPMGILHEILEARLHLGDTTPLPKLKREIIENSIYGIDIEQSAVEIAKLRFWLSIVVDEETPTPLPNLAYKIMVGNSLIETVNGFDPFEQNHQQSLFDNDDEKLEELQTKFHQYYNESNAQDKGVINDDINRLIDELLDRKLDEYEENIQSQLKNADIFKFDKKNTKIIQECYDNIKLIKKVKQRPTTELFFYKLYFSEVIKRGGVDVVSGFDVLIGNPPYVRHEKIKAIKERLKIEGYQSYNGTADLYIYFFEQGYRLLKEGGILSYITSNKYTRAKYGKQFREFVLNNTEILEYIDFNDNQIFESATVATSIFSYKKTKRIQNRFLYCDINEKYKKEDNLEQFISQKGFEYSQNDLDDNGFIFMNPKELTIKKIIDKKGLILKEWDIDIKSGIKTGFNEAFIIDGKIKDELIAKDSKNSEVIKPLLRGRDIKRYGYEFADKWLINIHNNPPIDIEKYPTIKEHLDNYLDKLSKRSDKGITPYNLRNCAYLDEFEKEKIIWLELTDNAKFTLDRSKYLLEMTVFFISGENLKYLLALLNSKVVFWYFNFICAESGVGTNRWKKQYVEQLSIPKISKEAQKPFETLVDQILELKVQNQDTTELENQIDAMVYQLYGLSEEEIAIVEGKTQ